MRNRFLVVSAVLIALAGTAFAQSRPTYNLSPESNRKFLADNAHKPGVVVLPSGLQYSVLKAGHGLTPKNPMDNVLVYYKGYMINGIIFDQTKAGHPAHFQASGLIRGWVEALRRMKEGDEWEIVIPANLAYGADGAAGGLIPPNQTLVFDMTLVQVAPAAP